MVPIGAFRLGRISCAQARPSICLGVAVSATDEIGLTETVLGKAKPAPVTPLLRQAGRPASPVAIASSGVP